MYCATCGHPNDDNAYRCTSCGEVLKRAGAPPAYEPSSAPASGGLGPVQQTWLVPSILATIFCCLPAGVVGIVFGAMANSANGVGDYAKAHANARTAKIWFWVSFGIGVAFALLYGGMMIIGVAAGAAGAGSGTGP